MSGRVGRFLDGVVGLRGRRSLAGQLLGVLLLAVVLGQTAVMAFWWYEGDGLHPLSREQALQRLASAFRLAQVVRPDRVEALLDAAGSPEAQFRVLGAPLVAHEPLNENERALTVDLHVLLDGDDSEDGEAPHSHTVRELRAHVGPAQTLDRQGHEWSAAWPRGARRLGLLVSVRMDDGRWFNARLSPIQERGIWPPLAWSLFATVLPLCLLVWLFVRRLLRPWRALAHAAERVSRGERVDPLPESGPRELRELVQVFNLMQTRQAAYLDDRTRLLAAISHDLRTPITSLRLRAELVDDDGLRRQMVRTLDDMRALVEETLLFARDEGRVEATRDIDLAGLCLQIVQDVRAAGHEVRLQFLNAGMEAAETDIALATNRGAGLPPDQAGDAALAPQVPYRGRPLALKRALGNLVDNAVRHGHRASLRLNLPDADRLDRDIVLDVDDDGPGIPEALLHRVFEPFFRVDDARGANPRTGPGGAGVGLGLAIARSCVQAHGGTLALINLPQGGLRARIVLPR